LNCNCTRCLLCAVYRAGRSLRVCILSSPLPCASSAHGGPACKCCADCVALQRALHDAAKPRRDVKCCASKSGGREPRQNPSSLGRMAPRPRARGIRGLKSNARSSSPRRDASPATMPLSSPRGRSSQLSEENRSRDGTPSKDQRSFKAAGPISNIKENVRVLTSKRRFFLLAGILFGVLGPYLTGNNVGVRAHPCVPRRNPCPVAANLLRPATFGEAIHSQKRSESLQNADAHA
jgi:hypothetical protein